MAGVVCPWWPNKVCFVGPWVIYWISKWMLYNIVFVPAIQRHDYSLHIKNDIQVYNRSRSKLIGEIRCIVPSLTDGNQNHFYRMLVCLVKRQAVIFSPSAGPLPVTFTCAGERAGESPGSGATHPWGLVRTASVSAFTENTRNQLRQCSTQ